MKTVPLAECNSIFEPYRDLSVFQDGVSQGQYCALDPQGKMISYLGDSGAALAKLTESLRIDHPLGPRYFPLVVGVVSFGMGSSFKLPSIYTRVAHYMDWIESIVFPPQIFYEYTVEHCLSLLNASNANQRGQGLNGSTQH